jgi:hypothetical protein
MIGFTNTFLSILKSVDGHLVWSPTPREETIWGGINMTNIYFRRTSSVLVGLCFALAAQSAAAFHPGAGDNDAVPPDPSVGVPPADIVPQGPYYLACENPGWNGIEIAIDADGQVHCDWSGEDGDGGGDGGDIGIEG